MTTTASHPAGRDAASPFAVPALGWKQILIRTWKEGGADNIGLIAAGVAFYGFLAMVPLLGAIVLSYGLIASPESVMGNIQSLTSVMPADAARLIGEQLLNVVQAEGGKKGFGLLLALAIALYGAMKGAGAVVTALNIAYDEKETRGFIKLNLVNLGITVVAIGIAILAVISIAAFGHLEKLFPGAPEWVLMIGKIGSYLLMGSIAAAGVATLFRYGPDRDKAKWTWLTPGSLAFTATWLVMTLGFGFYVANFGSYNATYGSLGAVVVLLTWIYLSAYVLLLAAELNSELERQTAKDTTAGAALPLGARGAQSADTVANGTEAGEDAPDADSKESGLGGGKEGDSDGAKGKPASGAPSAAKDFVVARLGGDAARLAGGEKPTIVPVLLATAGLSSLRREGGAGKGLAMLVAAGALTWLRRRPARKK